MGGFSNRWARVVNNKSATMIERPAVCAICREEHDRRKTLVHLATHHKGVVQMGDLYWLNRHDVIYNGKRYRRAE